MPTLSASLAYYTVFSLGPLILVVISLAGLLLGKQAVEGAITHQLQGLLGSQTTSAINTMVAHSAQTRQGIIGTIVGFVTLILGALGVFGQLKDALNLIWGVVAKPGLGIGRLVRERTLSLGMVVVIAFLLLVSLAISSVVSALSSFTGSILVSPILLEVLNFVLSFMITSVLFAAIYQVLPDVTMPWKPAFIGGVVAAALFSVGKTFIGLYIGNSASASAYGAAGSLIALLLWVYYTSQILLFGAEVVKAYMTQKSLPIRPNKMAVLAQAPIRDASVPKGAVNQDATRLPKSYPISTTRPWSGPIALVGVIALGFLAEKLTNKKGNIKGE